MAKLINESNEAAKAPTQVMALQLEPDVGLNFPAITEICRLMGFDAAALRSLTVTMGADRLTTAVAEFHGETPLIPDAKGFAWRTR